MSNKREREKRREERLREEERVDTTDRRTRLLQLGAGAVFLVIAVVVVLIIVNSSSSESGGDTKLEEVASVHKLVDGIPQKNLVLGDPKAKVHLIEFGDLQCPICRAYSEQVLPEIIQKRVRTGEITLEFRNFIIIGEDSTPAGEAAVAAGNQGKGWQFIELWYRNQGVENSGYVTEPFIESIAKGAKIPDLAKWNKERKEQTAAEALEKTTKEAQGFGMNGTPSFAIEGPGTKGIELLGTGESAGRLEEDIEKAKG